MRYQIEHQDGPVKQFREPRSGSLIPYHTAKNMRERDPNGTFHVIGEVGCFARPPDKGDVLIAGDGKEIPVHPRGSLIRPFEWVAGYIPVGKNSYIAAIRNPLCWLMRKTSIT